MRSAARNDSTGLTKAGSPERFGYEWGEYSEMRPEYEEQFRRWAAHLKPEDWQGRSFLDVGCGMGRNSYWPLSYGASHGVAIDVDPRSLEAARRTLARFPNARVLAASAYNIPFTDAFDIVFSIGVIHHLAQPARALGEMVRAARPGGRVLIWVYGRENNGWIVTFVDPLRKAILGRMPVALVHHLSLYPAILVWCALRLGLRRLAYFRLLREFSFRHLRSIVFDQMLPRISHYWPREAVEGIMQEAGLVDVCASWVNEMSWSVIGTKPAHVDGCRSNREPAGDAASAAPAPSEPPAGLTRQALEATRTSHQR